MNLEVGQKYYFWNIHTGDLDCLTVVDVFESSFSFFTLSCGDKLFSVSYTYALGKLFRDREDLPGYSAYVNRQKQLNVKKRAEQEYSPNGDFLYYDFYKDESDPSRSDYDSWDYYFNPDYDGEDYDKFGLIE